MKHEGPPLEHLLRRLIETPSDFLEAPRTKSGSGFVHVPAVVADMLRLHDEEIRDLSDLTPDDSDPSRRRAGVLLLLCWLLADSELTGKGPDRSPMLPRLQELSSELSAQHPSASYRNDPERREELVRTVLARLDMRPAGESVAHAQDRLTALSSLERRRVLAAAREAEARARAIREALARKAARESADKYTRE